MESIYDFFFDNSIYLVLVIVLIIWLGLFFYMNRIDNKLKKLENKE